MELGERCMDLGDWVKGGGAGRGRGHSLNNDARLGNGRVGEMGGLQLQECAVWWCGVGGPIGLREGAKREGWGTC